MMYSCLRGWNGGRVAQLGEHRVCNARVRGSNPLTSTKFFTEPQSTSVPNLQFCKAILPYGAVHCVVL